MPNSPILQQESASSNSIALSWDIPHNSGSEILAFTIYWDSGLQNGLFTSLATVAGNTKVFTKTNGLEAGVVYSFKATATNVVGESLASESLEVIAATVPLKVDQPIKHTASVSSMEIRWTQPEDGGSPITDYNV